MKRIGLVLAVVIGLMVLRPNAFARDDKHLQEIIDWTALLYGKWKDIIIRT